MTRYGWDASNHDWPRGPMDLARARREGISLFTHKASEGSSFTDPNFDEAMTRAQAAAFPVVGAYHVLWPENPIGQADYFLSVVDRYAPWWRQHPCFIFQTDAELFQEFKPYRQPTLAEIHAFSDRILARTGVPASRIPCYGPEWLYGNSLTGLRYPLWASAYGGNPAGPFAQHAAKDTDTRWRPYSGQTPVILQCGSNATIAGQTPSDINVIRVDTDAQLQALFLGNPGDDMPLDPDTKAYLEDRFDDLQNRLNLDRLTKIDETRSAVGNIQSAVGAMRPLVGATAAKVGSLGSAGQIDVHQLADALVTDLGPDLGKQLAIALGAAITKGATS